MNCPRCKDSICPHKPSSSDKWRYTLITTVVLLVIMNMLGPTCMNPSAP